MTEYELDQICQRTACDCNCMKCPYFAANQREELGLDEYDEDDEYDEEYTTEEQDYEFTYEYLDDTF